MNVPIVRWGHNAAVFVRGATRNGVGFEGVETHGVLWAVGFTQAVWEISNRTGFECGFEFIGEHAFPADFSHGGGLLCVISLLIRGVILVCR